MSGDHYTVENRTTGRGAEVIGQSVRLFKVTGTIRKTEHTVWPATIVPDEEIMVQAVADWLHHGKTDLFN